MIDDIKIEPDIKHILQRMDAFSDELQNKAMTSGLSAAASPIKKRMKGLAPTRSGGGALRDSISHKQLSKSEKAVMGVPLDQRGILVGPIKKVVDPLYQRKKEGAPKKIGQGYKAYWLEFTGAKRHVIPLRRGDKSKRRHKIIKFTRGDGKFATQVMHPGFSRHKFIGPSLSSAGSQVEEGFYTGMSKRLDKLEIK